jgi:uncharacterized protein
MARLVPKIYPNDINPNIPIGVGFPLNVGAWKSNYTTATQIKDNIRNLILTIKGERVMQPEFGSNLYHLLFEQMYDDQLVVVVRDSIKEAVRLWLPYVTILDVDVTSQTDKNTILIEVFYSVEGWPADDTLKLAVDI